MADSDNESDEEGDFEEVYGRTCMTSLSSGRSVRDHPWRVWICDAGVILMAIRLVSNYFVLRARIGK